MHQLTLVAMLLIIICHHTTLSTLGSVQHNHIVKGGLRNMAIGDLNIAGGGVEAYPIGSIYMSFNSTEPSILFGGT